MKDPNIIKQLEKGRDKNHLRTKRVDIERANKRLLTVLDRDIEALMKASSFRQLDENESKSLIAYLKLIRDLRRSKVEDADNLSDAEVASIAVSSLTEK